MKKIRKPHRKVKRSRKSPGGRKLAAAMRGVPVLDLLLLEISEAAEQKQRALQKKAAALAALAGVHKSEEVVEKSSAEL